MKSTLIAVFGMVLGLLAVSSPALAHHGGTEYDNDHQKTFQATVTQFLFINPHCLIYLDQKEPDGKVIHWAIETLAPAVMKRAGWSSETLKPGEEITITIAPGKNGTPIGMIRKVVLPDGQVLGAGAIGEPGS